MSSNAAAQGSANGLVGAKKYYLLAALVTASADFLFYDQPVGISAAIFICLLAIVAAVANNIARPRRPVMAAAGILAASLLPMIEAFGLFSMLSGLAGLSVYTLMISGGFSGGFADKASDIIGLLTGGPIEFFSAIGRSIGLGQSKISQRENQNRMLAWVLPLAMAVIFVILFRMANPVIEDWLRASDAIDALWPPNLARVLFWLCAAGLTWSFVTALPQSGRSWWMNPALVPDAPSEGAEQPTESAEQKQVPTRDHWMSVVFGRDAVLRSLLLFNALFAVQTVLDLTYLWGGASLPDGMTYADYAHRGAYPLLATALMSALFVLLAMWPLSTAQNSATNRALVYLWVAQNVLLVISSILRLELYIEVYSLSYWRIGALIWMVLVAVGLALIVTRIALRRDNEWLISWNVIALATTIYLCGFANFAHIVADHNVKQSLGETDTARALDVNYICALGAQAIPAMEAYVANTSPAAVYGKKQLAACLYVDIAEHDARYKNWRAWSFRDWRLQNYLNDRGTL